MNQRIRIHKDSSADTRSADHMVSRNELEKATAMHISDVAKAMRWFAQRIEEAGENHDWTKVEFMDEFYKQFHDEQITHKGDWMENPNGWYRKLHLTKERHHLNNACPEDVDLIDVIEMLCDCVMAGLARSGKYRDDALPPDLLTRAYKNTVKKLIDVIDVQE